MEKTEKTEKTSHAAYSVKMSPLTGKDTIPHSFMKSRKAFCSEFIELC